MKNNRNICILLIFLVFMITISAASAAEDVAENGIDLRIGRLRKKGTYSFTAKFAGNNMYAAITKTAKLTIK
jgi:hypothetical protein